MTRLPSVARGSSAFYERRTAFEILGPHLSFARIWFISQQSLHALVEVLSADRLCFAAREFACHLGLRFRGPGTGLRGGMTPVCAHFEQYANSSDRFASPPKLRRRIRKHVSVAANGVTFTLSPASAAELMEGCAVKLELGHAGDWIVDPRELAPRLGVKTTELKRMERAGHVYARIAAGGGEDEGLTQVTVRLSDKGWRGIFDRSGSLIKEEIW